MKYVSLINTDWEKTISNRDRICKKNLIYFYKYIYYIAFGLCLKRNFVSIFSVSTAFEMILFYFYSRTKRRNMKESYMFKEMKKKPFGNDQKLNKSHDPVDNLIILLCPIINFQSIHYNVWIGYLALCMVFIIVLLFSMIGLNR